MRYRYRELQRRQSWRPDRSFLQRKGRDSTESVNRELEDPKEGALEGSFSFAYTRHRQLSRAIASVSLSGQRSRLAPASSNDTSIIFQCTALALSHCNVTGVLEPWPKRADV